jgi:hypothetical protein
MSGWAFFWGVERGAFTFKRYNKSFSFDLPFGLGLVCIFKSRLDVLAFVFINQLSFLAYGRWLEWNRAFFVCIVYKVDGIASHDGFSLGR